MIHPSTEVRFINDEIGYGVVAKEFIPKGTITWAQDDFDQIFTPDQLNKMEPFYKNILDIYSFRNRHGNFVLCWDISRFVNHSFKSNCLTSAYDFEIAIRDIHPGEQLTDDYGYLNISEPFQASSEGTERTVVYPDDTVKYHEIWDKELNESFKLLFDVKQPLSALISTNTMERLKEITSGKAKMDSILTCYYDPTK